MNDNIAILIDPNQLYEVSYTIDHSGKRYVGPQMVLGSDLTENQIREKRNESLSLKYVPMWWFGFFLVHIQYLPFTRKEQSAEYQGLL